MELIPPRPPSLETERRSPSMVKRPTSQHHGFTGSLLALGCLPSIRQTTDPQSRTIWKKSRADGMAAAVQEEDEWSRGPSSFQVRSQMAHDDAAGPVVAESDRVFGLGDLARPRVCEAFLKRWSWNSSTQSRSKRQSRASIVNHCTIDSRSRGLRRGFVPRHEHVSHHIVVHVFKQLLRSVDSKLPDADHEEFISSKHSTDDFGVHLLFRSFQLDTVFHDDFNQTGTGSE
ncbi:hypothetical protein Z517_09295 [Fonsecaea pedrosoi CBS 271.37]|uniref:Uncharacterized protein n=1 Tax=Fonsecaea pedrosoi CBS 271.37 TaxID=1442368 RepID=A0A0D2DGN6_9EURO|nr:uncharacterized protein Z517_09295 [Fonsecaea pedrosoi CBS 271.37]KIW76851.1 hypothetical protein Z517_09295 [Fonsecaea pedrosoi CBS 271.37]